MNILITGAKGFLGKNLVENLKNIRDGKNCTRPNIHIEKIYEYDIDSIPEQLDDYCREADFVFNLAGINRPKDPEEFKKGNFSFANRLLDTLRKYNNTCPVMLSVQFRLHLRDDSVHLSMAFQRRPQKICFLNMQKKMVQKFWCIVSQTWLVNGCVQITILR